MTPISLNLLRTVQEEESGNITVNLLSGKKMVGDQHSSTATALVLTLPILPFKRI
jgi:hypothetical protein